MKHALFLLCLTFFCQPALALELNLRQTTPWAVQKKLNELTSALRCPGFAPTGLVKNRFNYDVAFLKKSSKELFIAVRNFKDTYFRLKTGGFALAGEQIKGRQFVAETNEQLSKAQLLVGFKKIAFDSWATDVKEGVQRHIKRAEGLKDSKNNDGVHYGNLLKCLHAYGTKVGEIEAAVNKACGNTCTLALKITEDKLNKLNPADQHRQQNDKDQPPR